MQSSRLVAQVVPTWQPAFLAELEQTGNISAACQAASVRMDRVRSRRILDPEFNERVTLLLRTRKLERGPNDQLVDAPGSTFEWEEPWQEDADLTVEQAFLMILARTLNASEAARMVGVSYAAYRTRRERYPEFDALCRTAIQRACDEIEGAIFTRALIESDQAAIALLRAHRPETYKREDVGKGDDSKAVTLEDAMKRGFTQRTQAQAKIEGAA